MRARQHKSVTRWRRDVTDGGDSGALGSYSEAQGARATSSGGYFGLGIHRTYPAAGTGGPRPVTGAIPGRQGRRGNPDHHCDDQGGNVGKGLIRCNHLLDSLPIESDIIALMAAES